MVHDAISLPNGRIVRLIQGDSHNVLAREIAPGSIDCTVTSPPFNLGIDYGSGYDDTVPRPHYLAWVRTWLQMLLRATAEHGSLFLNIWGKPSNPWGPFEVALEARAAGWTLQNTIFWVKSMTDGDGETIGHFKPLNSPRFVNDCAELLLHLTPAGDTPIDRLAVGVPFVDKSNLTRGGRGKNGDNRCRGNVWVVPYSTIKERATDRPHPATFPVELAERAFRLHGLARIRTTFDPFSGLGSTARAAAKLGLEHLGVELGAEDTLEAIRRVRADLALPAAAATIEDARSRAATEF